ncbi:hypothetical protein HUJ04_004695 [Dendroctonus ponderosae]|uniref:Kinetochore protein NDC80 n=2 Tax=Dendroctonus ponderosae TaxID=77166 RepID=A0AAR5PUI0_DENPD|nr:hypothetical protein HUJ04_004695 [Dendroctonus ponderosae]
MRRSNSASKIPLPPSMQTANMEARRRERSTSQLRAQSMDRLMVTPLGCFGGRNTVSAQKKMLWTPASSSRDSAKRSTFSHHASRSSRPKSPFDKRKSQFTNDKKWVNDQYHKILEFIEYSGLVNPELAKQLRPPTMTAFANLVSVLFEKLLPNPIPITSLNCIEVAVQALKLLEYSGQLSVTTLKTINTMHGWPNFISIISWLIDRMQMPEKISNAFEEHSDPSVQTKYKKYQIFHQFIYNVFPGASEDGEVNIELLQVELEKMRLDLNDIMGIDEKFYEKIEETLQCKQNELTNICQQIQEIKDKNLELSKENVRMQNTISDYEENKDIWEQESADEVAKLNNKFQKCSVEKEALVSAVNELKDCIASQPYTVSDKNELLSRIQDQKNAIKRKTKKIDEYRLIRDKMDLELDTELQMVEKRVDEWNVFITKSVLPELECLRLRESGFAGFLEELEALKKTKDIIATKTHQEYAHLMAKLEIVQASKDSLTVNQKPIEIAKQKTKELRAAIQAANKDKKAIMVQVEEFKTHPEKIKQIGSAAHCKIAEQSKIINALKDRRVKLENKKQNVIKSGLAALVEARDALFQTISLSEEKVNSILLEGCKDVEESTIHLQAKFEHLVSVKKISEQLLNTKLFSQDTDRDTGSD